MICFINLIFWVSWYQVTSSDIDLQDELSPKLEDILPSLQRKPNVYLNMTSAHSNTIDLEKFNLAKFKEKINILTNVSLQKKASRRQASVPIKHGVFIQGTDQRTRRKICDLMLQTIFMARHKIKQMAKDKYFKVTDTGYRVAYLYKRLSAIMKKMVAIYWTMRNHTEEWQDITPYLILHHKAARFHIDFNDLWWVLVRVDGAFKDGQADDTDDDEDTLVKLNG